MRLKDKVCVITGACSGMGLVACEVFAREGRDTRRGWRHHEQLFLTGLQVDRFQVLADGRIRLLKQCATSQPVNLQRERSERW